MKRRELLFGTGGIVGLAALGVGWRALASRPQQGIELVLRKHLSYLTLDPGGIQRFAQDLAATRVVSTWRMRLLQFAAPLYLQTELRRDTVSNHIRRGEETILTMYLLSSDYFAADRDAAAPVRYLGLFDQYRPCGTPFARRMGSPENLS
jgi:hypothetical protein